MRTEAAPFSPKGVLLKITHPPGGAPSASRRQNQERNNIRVIIPVDGIASSSEAIRFIGERARYMSEKPVSELIYVEPPIPDDVIDRIDIDALRRAYEASAK